MSSFLEMLNLITEADAPAPPPGPPGPPMGGGPPGGIGGPPGGLGAPGPSGGPPGGAQEPLPVKNIPAADVWELLEKVIKDDKFIEEIHIGRKKKSPKEHQLSKKTSLLK
jgi:hypothetical protein